MNDLFFSDSIVVKSSREALYDLVSDVTRTGEWSPICTGCWWDEGQSAQVDAWFTGRNEVPGRVWETRSVVVAADRGREFAFVVGGDRVRWGFTFDPADDAVRLTETWEWLPGGLAAFAQLYGDGVAEQIADRTAAAREGIPATLAAIARIAEGDRAR